MEKDESDRRHLTQAERAVKEHGGKISRGDWNHACDLTEGMARALALVLANLHYQVRHVVEEKKSKTWTVIFR